MNLYFIILVTSRVHIVFSIYKSQNICLNIKIFVQYTIHLLLLQDDAMMRDVILVIRADEAHHRLVNHTLSAIDPTDNNPYLQPGQKK